MGSAVSVINKKNRCIKCFSKLKLLRYCINQNCEYYLTNEEIEEHKWNDWMVFSTGGDSDLSQVLPGS